MDKRFRNVPNTLSFIRLLMVPAFIVVFFRADSLGWAGLIFALAGVTDILDGYIARRTGSITKLGRAIGRVIPVWVILILAAKELIQLTGGWLLLRRYHDVPPSNKYGKAASAVFYFVTIAVIVFEMPRVLQICLLGGALLLSLAALLAYAGVARRYMEEKSRGESAASSASSGTTRNI